MALRFLLLEDNRLDADILEVTLRGGGIDCELVQVETRADFVTALLRDEFDVILADYALPKFDGIAALEIACDLRPDVPFIFVSRSLGEELAIETLKRGATDYVLKQRLGRLVPAVQRALRETQERRQRKQTELILFEQKRLLELIASGHPLNECLAAICASVSGLHPGTRACFLLADAQGATFKSSITPDFASSFGEGLKDAPINDLCIGTCGEAVYRGKPINCADIANDDRWSKEWRDLCVAHGILACHSQPVMGADGQPLGSLMLCFDRSRTPTDWEYQLADFGTQVASIVFERDRSHLALQKSEAEYRTLFESIDEGFCICQMLFDENGRPIDYRLLKVNPAFETMTGLKQATGKTARELMPNLEASWLEIYGQVVLTGQPIRFEAQSVAMNNRWFDVKAFGIDAAQSHKFAILFADISNRKQVEGDRERFLAVGSDLQVITSINGYFKWVSPTFERILGWTAQEMTSRPWTDFVHPEDISASVSETGSLFSGNETMRFENRYRHKDGSYRWLLWKAKPNLEEQVLYGAAVDITDRKQAEVEIQQLNQQLIQRVNELQTLFELLPIGVAIAQDPECKTIRVNPYLSQLIRVPIGGNASLGAPTNERPAYRLCRDGEDIAIADLPMQYAALHNTSVQDEVVDIVHADGTVIKLLCYASPLLDEHRKVRGVLAAFVDITQRVLDEANLRENEERLKIALQTGKLGSWQLNLVTGVLDTSDRCKLNFGLPPEAELSYQRLFEFIHPDDRQSVQQKVQEAIADGIDYDAEYRIFWPDGSLHWIIDRGRALYDANGQPQQTIGVTLDITGRKLSEQQMQRTLHTLQTLIAASPLAIAIIERDCIVQLWNPAAEKLFDWSAAEVLGKPIPIVPPEKQEECRQTREAVMKGESFFGIETYRCKRDGSRVIVSISAALLDSNNTMVLLFQDITERQQAQEALQSSQAQLQTLFNAAPLGVYSIDGDFRIRQVNPTALPAFADIPGLIGRDFAEVIHILWPQEYADEVVQRFRHTLETGEPYFVPEQIKQRRDRNAIEYYEWQINRIPLPEGRYGVVCYFRDISAQVLARIAIAESESRFRLMVESAKDYAIFTLDLNGTIASWNFGAQKLLGYTETEALGRNVRIIFTPEDNEQGRAEWEMQTALTQERADNERWHVRQDGTRFWASGLMMPLQNEAGDIHGFVKILQDKTAKRQADQRLHLLYETTRDLLAAAHPMQLMTNLFSKLSEQLELHCYYNYMVEEKDNRLMLHLTNYGGLADDVARSIEWVDFGQYMCGLVAQQQRQIVLDAAQIAREPHAKMLNSMKITAYAGQPLIVRGRLLGSLSFCSLIRERFTLEETNLLQSTCDQIAIALERAELLSSIQQQAEQLQQANRIKDEFLAVLSHELRSPLNPILGWSQLLKTAKLDEAKTAQALDVIERNAKLQSELIEDLLDVSRILRGKLSLKVSRVDLVRTIQAAMETVRLAARAKSINLGFPILDLGLEIEEGRRQDSAALASPRASAEGRRSKLQGDSTPPEGEPLNESSMGVLNPCSPWPQQSTEGSIPSASCPLPSAFLDRDSQEPAEKPKSKIRQPESVAQETAQLWGFPPYTTGLDSPSGASDSLTFTYGNSPNPKFQVSGDPNRLQQVIWNLLSNAVKFTDVGGRVDIRLERVGGFAQISISDTGRGIDPDFLPFVFDYFRQEDGATTRKFGGLGLGLAIVRHLVELHGGTVQAQSRGVGQGATFIVRLPSLLNPSPINSDNRQSQPSLSLQGIKVLVVDDDTDTREFLAFMLKHYQAEVTAVASAVEAIATLTQSQSDVLVSDIGMPQMDGYMLMRQVRALAPAQGGQIKAIALTAYAGEIDYQQAMLAGFQRHVPKPVEPEVLVKAITDLVQQVGGQTKP
ncbi:MAG: PAS domain S-box protein [Nostoc sp. ChiSLP02]|nr:PAS domain S-box protein [Nostoc sp. DedSLP05]MDZ8103061.1 PAS domain S-box protein [Nostoc sp. DedSLP01]MDZ8183382.1 PAS domain S-box protein [Nostoc sp. ChiSLP02]